MLECSSAAVSISRTCSGSVFCTYSVSVCRHSVSPFLPSFAQAVPSLPSLAQAVSLPSSAKAVTPAQERCKALRHFPRAEGDETQREPP